MVQQHNSQAIVDQPIKTIHCFYGAIIIMPVGEEGYRVIFPSKGALLTRSLLALQLRLSCRVKGRCGQIVFSAFVFAIMFQCKRHRVCPSECAMKWTKWVRRRRRQRDRQVTVGDGQRCWHRTLESTGHNRHHSVFAVRTLNALSIGVINIIIAVIIVINKLLWRR